MAKLGNQAFRFQNKQDKLTQIIANPRKKVIAQSNGGKKYIIDTNKLSLNANEKQIVKLNPKETISLVVNWWGI